MKPGSEITIMDKPNKEPMIGKALRVVIDLALYEELKSKCIDHGDISRLIRYLLREWLKRPESQERGAVLKAVMGGND